MIVTGWTTLPRIMAADTHSPNSPSQTLADLHISLEVNSTPASSPPPMLNGFKTSLNGLHHNGAQDGVDPTSKLQQELDRTRAERDEYASQYRNLLGKLHNMRNTLGNKLKQDAVRVLLEPPLDHAPTRTPPPPRKSSTDASSKSPS